MKYFICYYRYSVNTEKPVVFVTDSEQEKDDFLRDAFNSDIEGATYKTIILN